MTLQEILWGTWMPPERVTTRVYNFMKAPKKEPLVDCQKPAEVSEPTGNMGKVYNFVVAHPRCTSGQIKAATGLTSAQICRALLWLSDKRKIDRIACTGTPGNQKWVYVPKGRKK